MAVVTEIEGERCSTEAPRGSITDGSDVGVLGGSLAGFEHRRAIASARRRLFGAGPILHIGRYRVDGRLGAGGMGEVYLGLDEALGRKVAVKRVHAGLGGDKAQERLRREARALARLSHPNVVQVYEIGEHEQRTFLAMEFVDGQTLGAWLDVDDGGRGWREILTRFVAAGRGLAAAHQAGVIHRDFKPENVLLGKDGSVRVADFGLALGGEGGLVASERARGADHGDAGVDVGRRLSSAGAIVGTIRYMSPEQLRGDELDARSDQFSFCVALYEALWGAPPFALGSLTERVEALEGGRPMPPSRGPVPAALWRVIRRGLACEPDQRWPDMDALLAALLAVPRRRRRRSLLAIAGVGLSLCSAVAVVAWPRADPCAGVVEQLAGIWDPARRDALEQVFSTAAAAGVSHAEDSRARVLADLDGWSAAWIEQRRGLCREPSRAEVDARALTLRDQCLLRQRAQVQRLVDELLAPGESPPIAAAVTAAAELPAPEACADTLALIGLDPPAADATLAVETLRADIDAAAELRVLGRLARGQALIEDAHRRAVAIGYEPALAEATAELALYQLAIGDRERGHALRLDAVDLAEASRHDQLAATLWTSMAMHAAGEFADFEGSAAALRRASAAQRRVGAPRDGQARLAYVRGLIASGRGQWDQAEAALREALALFEEVVDEVVDEDVDEDERAEASAGRDALELPGVHLSLATVLRAQDRAGDSARPEFEAAVAEAERIWGPQHPETARYVYHLGLDHQRAGELEQAQIALARAAEIWTDALEPPHPPHPSLVLARSTLAQLALRAGDLDGAQAQADRLAAAQRHLPADHPDRGAVEYLRATIAGVRNHRAEALAHCRRAIELWAPSVDPRDPRLLAMRRESASHLTALGRLDEAAAVYRELLAEGPGGAGELLPIRLGLAEIELRRGELEQVAAQLDAVAEAGPPTGAYALSHALLQALVEQRLHRRVEAQTRARLAAALLASPFSAAQLQAWYGELEIDADEREALGLVAAP